MKKILILGLMFLLMVFSVSAIEQTQQSNKIFLSPFYRISMATNTNYTYTVTVNPPDGISKVSSAIVTFNIQINGQSQNFTLWVNGGYCNNADYSIATAFSTTGNNQIYFDCSNRITKAGVYNITIRSTVATGTLQGWLDLTYMNKPGYSLDVHGTEYEVGDPGKTFVQLLENGITPINNASCYATIFYPNGVKWYDKTLMTYQTGSNALYYFDFTVPTNLGVYMVDVMCEYYTSTRTNNATQYIIANGTYMFGNGSSLTLIDQQYLSIAETNYNQGLNSGAVSTVLMGNLDEYTGTTTLDSSVSPTTGTHFNGVITGLPGTSGFSTRYDGVNDYTLYTDASKFDLTASEQYMVCFAFNQTTSNANGNRIVDSLGAAGEGYRFSFDGGNKIRFISDRAGTGAQTVDSTSTYVDSLWHTVCGYANFTHMNLYIDGSLITSQAKTQSGLMTITTGVALGSIPSGASNFGAVGVDQLCYMKGTSFTGSNAPGTLATNYNTNKQCGTGNNVVDINTTIPGITVLTDSVYYNIVTTYTYDELGENINVFLRNFTGSSWFALPNPLTYSTVDSTVSSQLTVNISQFLSSGNMIVRYVDSNNTGGLIGILKLDQVRVDQVNYVDLPISSVRGGGELHVSNNIAPIPQNVWNYVTRTLTSTMAINATEISENVWNYTQRNLTYYPNMTVITQNVTVQNVSVITQNVTVQNVSVITQNVTVQNVSVITQNVTVQNITVDYTALQGYVWNASNRNLTYYPAQVDLTNYSLINFGVWNYMDRNLTYYPDVTNYSLGALYVWNYVDRNLTYYPTVDYLTVSEYLWNFTGGRYINGIII